MHTRAEEFLSRPVPDRVPRNIFYGDRKYGPLYVLPQGRGPAIVRAYYRSLETPVRADRCEFHARSKSFEAPESNTTGRLEGVFETSAEAAAGIVGPLPLGNRSRVCWSGWPCQ